MSTIYLLVLALVLVAASEFTSPPSTPGGFGPTPSPAPSGTPGGFGPTHSPAPSGTSSGFGPTPSPAPSGTPTPSATACDAICPVGTCDKPVDADKPECEACSQCHNGGAPSLSTPASSPNPGDGTLPSTNPGNGPRSLCTRADYDALASDAVCQLWLDAGHSCSTKWDDVCATAHPDGAEFNSNMLSMVDCRQCGGGLRPSPLPPTNPGDGTLPSTNPGGAPTPSATACDAICPVGTCDKPADADKPECEACSQCHNGGAPSLTTPASSPMPVPSPFDPLVVPPPMNIPPQGFEAPKLLGAHFLAANPSKAVVLTFNVPTNEGGMLCFGYCLCSFLLDDETVRLLQVLRSPASFVPRAVSPMCLPRRCGTNIASRRRCATGR